VAAHYDCDVANLCSDEFCAAMGSAIPALIELLNSKDHPVPASAASALARLAKNSEWQATINESG
jgi:hypothetical protein